MVLVSPSLAPVPFLVPSLALVLFPVHVRAPVPARVPIPFPFRGLSHVLCAAGAGHG